jgi:aryl-alcohol dehydrogenase-like predicted oxidoreductase
LAAAAIFIARGEDHVHRPLELFGWHVMKSPSISERNGWVEVDTFDEIAKELGRTPSQIAINWVLQRPTVSSVIIGVRNEAQLRQKIGAVGRTSSDDHVARLDAASETRPSYPCWH